MENKQVKVYSAQDLQVDEGRREVISIINSAAIDRDGEVVQPKGMRKKDFQGNPVVFANHAYITNPNALPIGYSKWIKSGTDSNGNDILIAKTYISDKTQEARDVFGLLQDGSMKSFSIGFQSNRSSAPSTAEINARPDLKGCKNIVRDWTLYEYSVVGIPCNPEALAMAVSKGYSSKVLDMLGDKPNASIKLANEIVEAVKNEPAFQAKKISAKEIHEAISKGIDEAVSRISADAVMKSALRQLIK